MSNEYEIRLGEAVVRIKATIESNDERLAGLYRQAEMGDGSPGLDRRIEYLEGRIGGQRDCLEILEGI